MAGASKKSNGQANANNGLSLNGGFVQAGGTLIKSTVINTSGFGFSVGNGVAATGADSYAIGFSATASGNRSIAIGTNVTASNTNAVAIGTSSQATAGDSYAFGFGAIAGANGAVCIATGDGSTQITNNVGNSIAIGVATGGNTTPSLFLTANATLIAGLTVRRAALLGVVVNNMIENDGTNLYYTNNSGVRRQILLSDTTY